MTTKAAIFGATGLVGGHLLDLLLEDDRYSEVVSYARKSVNRDHPKLREVIGDLLEDGIYERGIDADHVYCCIGTTQAKTPDLSTYKAIDYGIPLKAAKAAAAGGSSAFLVISSMGASRKSKSFYLRNKAHMEAAVEKVEIEKLYILRPALLEGKRNELRLGEKAAATAIKLINWLLPKKYRSIHGKTVARAMRNLAFSDKEQLIYESHDIRKLAQSPAAS